MVTCWY